MLLDSYFAQDFQKTRRSGENYNDGNINEDDGGEASIPEREIILADQFSAAKRKNRHTCGRPTL